MLNTDRLYNIWEPYQVYILHHARLIIASGFLIRFFLILTGFFDSEVGNAIIPALFHPYQNPGLAPYGIIWYIISAPFLMQLPGLSYAQSWLLLITILDTGVLFLLRNNVLFVPYNIVTLLMWRQAPYNLPIIWLIMLGTIWWPALFIAVLAKFPVGAPMTVWSFIFNSSVRLPSNWRYYGLMAGLWILVAWRGYSRRKHS